MSRQLFGLYTSLILFLIYQPAKADITAENCKVAFFTTGKPVRVEIHSKTQSNCTGTIKLSGDKIESSTFEANLEELDTGIALRNKHLKENYLELGKFPKVAKFKLAQAADAGSQKSGSFGKKSVFRGEMELHGQTKEIAGEYEVSGKKVTAKFDFPLTKFGITAPSFMGVTVADKIDITVTFDIKE